MGRPGHPFAEVIDSSFICALDRPCYDHTGQPWADAVLLSNALLIRYPYGIASERRRMQEIQLSLAYHWCLGYVLDEAAPDHSVPSKAGARFGLEALERLLQRSIELRQGQPCRFDGGGGARPQNSLSLIPCLG